MDRVHCFFLPHHQVLRPPLKSIVILHHLGTALALLSPGGAPNSTPLSMGHQIGGRLGKDRGLCTGGLEGGFGYGGGGLEGLPDRVGGSEIGHGAGVTPEERSGWFGAGSR